MTVRACQPGISTQSGRLSVAATSLQATTLPDLSIPAKSFSQSPTHIDSPSQ
jgi:hypothetical protein